MLGLMVLLSLLLLKSPQQVLDPTWSLGKAVVITGCDSGLGYSLALFCHSLGLVVVALCHNGVSSEGADSLLEQANTNTMFVIKHFDVTDSVSVEKTRVRVEQILGETNSKLWAVINNAGMLVMAKLEWQTEDIIDTQINVNLKGPIRVCQSFLPLLSNGSRIINVTSPAAETHLPMTGVYSATKAGLEAVSDSLRIELAARGVFVTLFDPGYIISHTPFASRQEVHYKAMEKQLNSHEVSQEEVESFTRCSNIYSLCMPRPLLQMLPDSSGSLYRSFTSALTSQSPSRRYSASSLCDRLWELYVSYSPTQWGDRAKAKLVPM